MSGREPSVRPTRIGVLLSLTGVAAVLGWMVVSAWAGSGRTVRVPVTVPLALLVLTVALWWVARPVRRWRSNRSQPLSMDRVRAARTLALARACSRGGAALTGWFLGHASVAVRHWQIEAQRELILILAGSAVAGALLCVVGYLVEGWFRLPGADGSD